MKHLLPDDNCLTQDQILRYLSDKTSPEENQAIDSHLMRCPMCSDAIEGAMLLDTPTLEKEFSQNKIYIAEKANEIKLQETTLKPAKKSFKFIRFALAAAASIALLAVVGLWIFTKPLEKSPDIALENTAIEKPSAADSAYFAQQPVVIEPVEADRTPLSQPSTSTAQNNAVESVESPKNDLPQPNLSDKEAEITTFSSERPLEDKTEVTKPVRSNEPDTKNIRGKEAELAQKSFAEQAESTKSAKKKDTEVSEDAKYSGAAKQALPSPQARTAAPSPKIQKIEKSKIDDNTTLARGVQFLQDKDYDKAIVEFNSILTRQKEGDLYEKTLWYSANAYFQKNDKAYSKNLYQRIAKEQGKYATQAELILKNWK